EDVGTLEDFDKIGIILSQVKGMQLYFSTLTNASIEVNTNSPGLGSDSRVIDNEMAITFINIEECMDN
ncbi:hypothetical protein PCANC_20265, partial [Puccinia coronata f. sp. avenae]